MENLSENSWIEIHENIVEISFDDFMNDRPEKKHKIMLYGKLIECPRYQKLYGDGNYKFSGTTLIGDKNLSKSVEILLNTAKQLYPDVNYNGVLVNWYMNGDDYICAHADDEKNLQKDSPILSFSFGAERTFRIRHKDNKKIKADYITKNNSLIVMGGNMQKEFTHEITKTKKVQKPRINVTIRAFNW